MRLVALVGLLAANSASAFVIPSTQVVGAPAKASAVRSYAVRAVRIAQCRERWPIVGGISMI